MTSSPEDCRPWQPPALELEGLAQILPFPQGALETPEEVPWSLPELTAEGNLARVAADARSILEAARNEAHARGHAEGLREGTAAARRELQPAEEALRRAAESLSVVRDSLTRNWVDNLHALALGIARKLIQRELETDPEIVHALIRRALEHIPPDGPMEIRLNPEDLRALGAEFPAMLEAAGHGTVQIKPDASLERGSFLLENPHRIVDGRVDVALRALYERLEDE